MVIGVSIMFKFPLNPSKSLNLFACGGILYSEHDLSIKNTNPSLCPGLKRRTLGAGSPG